MPPRRRAALAGSCDACLAIMPDQVPRLSGIAEPADESSKRFRSGILHPAAGARACASRGHCRRPLPSSPPPGAESKPAVVAGRVDTPASDRTR